MPEGDTIHRTAATLPSRAGGTNRHRVRDPATAGRGARTRRTGRARRGPRQAPADRLLGRAHAAHAHADDGLLAHVPRRRALAQASRLDGGPHRDRRCGSRVLLGARGAGARRRRARTPTAAARARPRPVLGRGRSRGHPRAAVGARPRHPDRRRPARPAGRGRHRQRLQERDPVGLRRRPLHAARGDRHRRSGASSTPRRATSSGPTSTRRSNAEPSPRVSPSTTGPDAPAGAAAPRSSAAVRATRDATPGGVPPARLDPHGTRSHRSDAGPPPPPTGWRPTPPPSPSNGEATRSTRRWPPPPRSPSSIRTCAGWAATCSPWCSIGRATSWRSMPADERPQAPTPRRPPSRVEASCRSTDPTP